ncbi:hypothetical protein GCM10020331_097360 [Ectobacillus funiculus]
MYEEGRLPALKEQWDAEVDRLCADQREEGLSQTQVVGEINRAIDEKGYYYCCSWELTRRFTSIMEKFLSKKTYHMEYGFSCMGYEVAGALGIKMAEPDQEVYTIVGDGSYLMLHTELVTSIQENINILLFDNHGFHCIHNLQRGQGSEGFGNEFRYRVQESNSLTGDCLPIDFAANARSLGAKGYTVHTVEELREALEQAKKETVSTLIDIKVLPGTCTTGYEAWWRLGVAEVSTSENVQKAYEKYGS